MTKFDRNLRVIASILLQNKRLVKGKNFSNYLDAGDPVKTCIAHDSQFCDEISIIDLDAYKKNIEPDLETLKLITKETSSPILFGGNINNFKVVEKLIRYGADKILINSNIFNKNLTKEIINTFGKQTLVGGIDLTFLDGKYFVYKKGELLSVNYLNYIKQVVEQEVGEIKITFVNLEGTRSGLDIKTAKEIVDLFDLPVIIEGGVKNLIDLEKGFQTGINAIAIGALFVFSDNNIFKVKQFLDNRNLKIRLRN